MEIRDLKKLLRNGEFSWPGGYPRYFVTFDGEPLCFKCARKEFRLIIRAMKQKSRDGWCLIGYDIHWEGGPLQCCNCNAEIPSAYGEGGEE